MYYYYNSIIIKVFTILHEEYVARWIRYLVSCYCESIHAFLDLGNNFASPCKYLEVYRRALVSILS